MAKMHLFSGILRAALLALAVVGAGAAADTANKFRFSIIGDRTGGAIPEVYEKVWEEVGKVRPAFAINVGDSIEGNDDARAESEWKELQSIWARHPFPFYLTPGNHDIWSDYSARLFEKVAGRPPQYSFHYQNAHFTVLDNSRTTDLSEQQLAFLEEDLKANRGRDPKFVFFHKPFWIVFVKLGSSEFALHRLAKLYGVDYVISGHGHQFLHMEREGIVYMEVGSSGANVTRRISGGGGFHEGWFFQHVIGRVEGGKVEFTVQELGPPYGQARSVRVTAPEAAVAAGVTIPAFAKPPAKPSRPLRNSGR
jgi:hypothetical protein